MSAGQTRVPVPASGERRRDIRDRSYSCRLLVTANGRKVRLTEEESAVLRVYWDFFGSRERKKNNARHRAGRYLSQWKSNLLLLWCRLCRRRLGVALILILLPGLSLIGLGGAGRDGSLFLCAHGIFS